MNGYAAARDMAVIDQFMPYVQAELDRLEKALVNQTLQALDRSELTAEQAFQAWTQLNAYRKVTRGMRQKANMTLSEAEKVAPELTKNFIRPISDT